MRLTIGLMGIVPRFTESEEHPRTEVPLWSHIPQNQAPDSKLEPPQSDHLSSAEA